MPTGYTADVEDGKITTLAEFIRTCAPAFILGMRESPRSSPIPERSTYKDDVVADYERRVKAALDTIYELEGLTDQQCDDRAKAEYDARVAQLTGWNDDKKVKAARYEEMLTQTRTWAAPSILSGIKDFMIEQLEKSLDFDCTPFDLPPPPLPGAEWRTQEIARTQDMHKRWSEELVKQRGGQRHNNEFMATLHAELARLEHGSAQDVSND